MEAPICWEREYDPNVVEAYLQGTHETVVQGYNHPSVIFWSLGNESNWNPGFTDTHNLVRKLDPYRPVIFHSARLSNDDPLCDLTNVHYPGLSGPQDHASETRP
ncbi:MAG: glycoside hydrolase family 2, partial [Deltaproteobacteria bacterium]|nr:glycoside hydrolase family 2 [Deltaproteobacteria bacterium]